MKNIIKRTFFIAFIFAVGASFGAAQGIFGKLKERVKTEAKTQTNSVGGGSGYCFARIDVRTSWTERGQKVYETRVYYSNVIPYKSGDSKMVENLAKYFEDGVAAPLEARGFEVTFYDSDIKIYPFSYSFETVEEGEKTKEEQMDTDKSNKTTIYTFVWKYNGKPSGEETTQPKRVFSTKPAPALETPKAAANIDPAAGPRMADGSRRLGKFVELM